MKTSLSGRLNDVSPTVKFRCPPKLLARMRIAAKKSKRSQSRFIRDALEHEAEAVERKR